MIEINIDELNKLETDINDVFDQLTGLKESINTPNISKKIDEFNEVYYQVKDSIKESNTYLDTQVKNIIKNYEGLYKDIKVGVNND